MRPTRRTYIRGNRQSPEIPLFPARCLSLHQLLSSTALPLSQLPTYSINTPPTPLPLRPGIPQPTSFQNKHPPQTQQSNKRDIHTTALATAHLSAHIPTGKLAFSTFAPLTNSPSLISTVAPTRKLEYGPMSPSSTD